MLDLLPDSRCKNETIHSKVVDWPVGPLDGPTVRLEVVMVYCINCGCEYGWVPRENTTACSFLCGQCFDDYGAIAGTMALSDQEFWDLVAAEMVEEHGRQLSDAEIAQLMEQGRLGSGLEKLAKESPIKV